MNLIFQGVWVWNCNEQRAIKLVTPATTLLACPLLSIRLYSVFSIHTNVVSLPPPAQQQQQQNKETFLVMKSKRAHSSFYGGLGKLRWNENWMILIRKIKEIRGKNHPSHSYNFLCALCWRWTLIFISLLPLARFTSSFSSFLHFVFLYCALSILINLYM
jgi:hypothetical protein